jgi:hypothetical protein
VLLLGDDNSSNILPIPFSFSGGVGLAPDGKR